MCWLAKQRCLLSIQHTPRNPDHDQPKEPVPCSTTMWHGTK